MAENKELVDTSVLDELRALYPQDPGDSYEKTYIPEIRFKAKTVLDDNEKVVYKAGTFVIVNRSEEEVDGKYDYTEVSLGNKLNANVIYSRYKLSMYDGEKYIQTPIFDDKDNEIIKLFGGGQQVASGTMRELQALYQFQDAEGKTKTSLKLVKVLYVLVDGELRQLSLGGGNVYGYSNYLRELKKQNLTPSMVHTEFDSEKTEHGGNKYNQVTFKNTGLLTQEEALANLAATKELIEAIKAEKAFYGNTPTLPASEATTVLPSGDDF
jgi:hypothetical protein